MDRVLLLLQAVLLILTIVAWWAARRDLLNIATTQQTPTLDRIEDVTSAVHGLLDELDKKVSEVEERVHSLSTVPFEPPKPVTRRTAKRNDDQAADFVIPEPDLPVRKRPARLADGKYGDVHALAESGLSVDDIAQRTGLGSAEVEMVISLHPLPEDE